MADVNRRNRGGMNQRDIKNVNKGGNRIEFRFLIPSRAASIIIGKGGERIQRLRHECNARLSIPDNHGPERVFILESTMDNCIKIWRDCLPELKEFMFPSNMESRRAPGPSREDGPDMDLRFLVHDSQVGAIIGKGGVNVKNLRMQFQLNIIKVFPVTAPFSSDRLVQMVGKFEKVFECFRVIYETLEGQTIKGLVENYNSANFDENLTSGYGGWGFDNMRKSGPALLGPTNDRNQPQNGRFNNRPNDQFFPKPEMNRSNSMPKPVNRFDTYNDISNEEPPFVEMENDNFQMPFNRLPIPPADQNFPAMRKRNIMDIEPDNMKRGRMGGMNNVFDSRNDNKPPPHLYDNRNNKPNFYDGKSESNKSNRMDNSINMPQNNPSIEKVDVSIPTTLIQAIKGFNDEVLSNIINDSGAEIITAMNDEESMDTILSLTGTKDQIEGAQYLLQICIKKSVLNL